MRIKEPQISQDIHNTFSFLQKPFCKQKPLRKIASQKTCAKRKTKRMFLVKVFTEGKKVVGKAFLSKKRFVVK
jgi:hypothetical protein